jgi:DNA-binding CsgD family transcriptional regulator
VTVVSSNPQQATNRVSLADLLLPMQFKAVLLFAHGLTNCEIAQVLATTEEVVKNALRDAYNRTGCWNGGELLRRYFRELADGLLELGRLRRELEELENRATAILDFRPGHVDILRHIN